MIWKWFFATLTAWALVLIGFFPAVHHHEARDSNEAHCRDSGPATHTHLETSELEHHESCDLCAQVLSSARLDRPRVTNGDARVTKNLVDGRPVPTPGAPGRHGASRAPPSA